MRLSLRRVFDEKRRLAVPLLAALAVNIVLYGAVVYPLSVRARSADARATTATDALRVAERDHAAARGVAAGRDRTDAELKAFYRDVLPSSFAQATQSTYLRLSRLAEQHNLRLSRSSTQPGRDNESSLASLRFTMNLEGNYEDIRRFIHGVESGADFIVIDSVVLRQGAEPGGPLTLELGLATYYRANPDGA